MSNDTEEMITLAIKNYLSQGFEDILEKNLSLFDLFDSTNHYFERCSQDWKEGKPTNKRKEIVEKLSALFSELVDQEMQDIHFRTKVNFLVNQEIFLEKY